MTRVSRLARGAWLLARLAAAAVALARLAGAARRRPPLTAARAGDLPSISVLVPARDEADRIGPLLDAVCGAPGVREVLVVDDQSTDATAEVARAAGARVLSGAPLPAGWAGKAWALDQGVRAAVGEWVVTLDADTRPSPDLPRALVARAQADWLQFVTVGGRFRCPTWGAQWLHPALLTTLVYRFGPPDRVGPVAPDRLVANGQCMAFERAALVDAGGLAPVSVHVVEDVALARHLAGLGWRVAMLDGPLLLTTEMFDDGASTFTGWSRSLSLPGVEPRWRAALDAGVVLLAQALPVPRLLARRGDVLDVLLLAARTGTLAGTASAYERRGVAYWLSPLADPLAAAALVRGLTTRTHRWRGRTYPRRISAGR
jgi:dolichol-phosphate mannosyltransferase